MAQLAAGVVGDPGPWIAGTGIEPQSLDRILAMRPSTVQDRWFARLYLLKPVAIVAIAVAGFTMAALQFVAAWKLAGALAPGVPGTVLAVWLAPGLIAGLLAVLLGAATLFRRTARPALLALAGLTVLYCAGDIITSWNFGFFPFGVFAYKVPLALALLFTLCIIDDR